MSSYQRTVTDLNESWMRLVNLVMNEGKPVAPRNLSSIEVENVSITYSQPTFVFKNRIRRLNPIFHLVELFYFMDGRNDGMLINYIAKMADFANSSMRFDGSYGPAMYESLPFIILQLMGDRSSRRAGFPMIRMQHVAQPTLRDFPCNIMLWFRIRENKLNMNVVTRSQDLYRGFLYDTLEFQLLQTMIARLLKVDVGTYHHNIFSLHLYDEDIDRAHKAANIRNTDGPIVYPTLPNFDTFHELWEWSHIHCMIADLARNPDQIKLRGAGQDDIESAILRYKTGSTLFDNGGIYTTWVKEWLER